MSQTSQSPKIGVGTLFISSKTQRVLLNLRAAHKTHPMCWSLWGGMMEEGEKPKQALLRELCEEMGDVPDIEKIYPFDIYESRNQQFKYYSFVCVVEEEFVPVLNNESCGYCWVDLGSWPRPMHQGARISFCNQKSIERLKSMLMEHVKIL